jgi:hypothetical protein
MQVFSRPFLNSQTTQSTLSPAANFKQSAKSQTEVSTKPAPKERTAEIPREESAPSAPTLSFLDDKANATLNKALEDKSLAQQLQIRGLLNLTLKINETHDVQNEGDRVVLNVFEASKSATVESFENFIQDFQGETPEETQAINGVVQKFLYLYKADYTPLNITA